MARKALSISFFSAVVALCLGSANAKADLLPGFLGGNCGATSQVFAQWGDPGSYYFAPNGGFEAGASGWALSGGARVVGGNEPFYVHSPNDRSALDLPAGSTATSPPLCFGVAYPRLRFFAVSTSDAPATIRVRVVSWSLLGGLKILDAGSVTAGTSWAPPSYMCLGSALASVVGTKVMQIQLVPSAGVRIDDVYVDPLLQEV